MLFDYVDLTPVPVFLVAVAFICLAPGPDMAYMVGAGLAGGRSAATRAAFGITVGVAVYVAATAAGLGVLVASLPGVLVSLQVLGAGYLAWLAYATFQESRKPAAALAGDQYGRKWFGRGFVVNLTNPKIMLFFLAFLPQFLGTASNPMLQLLMFGLLFQLAGLVVDLLIGRAAGAFRTRVLGKPARLRLLTRISAVVFAVLAVLVITEVLTHLK